MGNVQEMLADRNRDKGEKRVIAVDYMEQRGIKFKTKCKSYNIMTGETSMHVEKTMFTFYCTKIDSEIIQKRVRIIPTDNSEDKVRPYAFRKVSLDNFFKIVDCLLENPLNRNGLSEIYEKVTEEDIKRYSDVKSINGEEREILTKARVNQGTIRENAMKKYNGKCVLCGIGVDTALRASHIKSWADGKKINIAAYNINGNNYVKLRDIAQAADFKVWYNAEKGTVEIDSDEPYSQDEVADAAKNTLDWQNEDVAAIPQAGDIIIADNDGYRYEIKDISRYSNSMFSMNGQDLPKLKCDRSLFPKLALPNKESRHFSTKGGEYLFVRNLYEMRRMEYTMYNLISANPQSWQDGKLALKADGTPLVKIGFDVGEKEAYNFWPFRESELAKLFNEWASGTFELEAWDVYKDGAFQYTEYLVYVE